MNGYQCICGRVHASWWGRYVPAPSCRVTAKQATEHRFFALAKKLRGK